MKNVKARVRSRAGFGFLRIETILKKDNRAIILPLFALMFAAMMAFLGLVFDGGRLYFEKRRMQVAADSAAWGGAWEMLRGQTTTMIESGGRDDAALNNFTNGQQGTTVDITILAGSCVEAEISKPHPTTFMRVVGETQATVAARAVACIQQNPRPPCILSLNCTDDGPGLLFNGGGTITANNCDIIINSKADDAIRANGTGNCPNVIMTGYGVITYGYGGGVLQNGANNCITCPGCLPPDQPVSSSLCAKDPYCSNYATNDESGYPTGCAPLPDPWEMSPLPGPPIAMPNIGGGNYDTFTPCAAGFTSGPLLLPCFDAANEMGLSQPHLMIPGSAPPTPIGDPPTGGWADTGGLYYDKININSGYVHFYCTNTDPGCLLMTDEFRISGGTVTGDGSTYYVTPVLVNKGFNITGNAGEAPDVVSFTAPTGGPFHNMLFFSTRLSDKGCTIIGGSNYTAVGTTYCPNGELTYGGNSQVDMSASVASVIADTIVVSGTPDLSINYDGAGINPDQSHVVLVD